MPARHNSFLAALMLVACACSIDDEGRPAYSNTSTLSRLDTLLTAGDTTVGDISDIAVAPDGRVYLADIANSKIVVLDTTGTVDTILGRTGDGPGEFRVPRMVHVTDNEIVVLDHSRGFLIIDLDGRQRRVFPPSQYALSGRVSLAAHGAALISTGGESGALARRQDSLGRSGSGLGQPVVASPTVWPIAELKEEIRRGSLPELLRNIVLPVLGEEGSAWLLREADGIVEHYTAGDSLAWTSTISSPEFAEIRRAFFIQAAADTLPRSLHALQYFADADPVGSSLWILLNQPDDLPAVVLVLGPRGRVIHRLRIPVVNGAGKLAVDRARRWLYLQPRGEAALYRVHLADSIFGGDQI